MELSRKQMMINAYKLVVGTTSAKKSATNAKKKLTSGSAAQMHVRYMINTERGLFLRKIRMSV
jgi:hypothetical protein